MFTIIREKRKRGKKQGKEKRHPSRTGRYRVVILVGNQNLKKDYG
jgi:hypothetical protein